MRCVVRALGFVELAPFPGANECKQLYWRKLKSMQDEVKSSDLPSIRVLFDKLFF